MSRFHFDENVMENAAASLKAVNQELGGCLVELTLIKTVVQKEKGYNINEICNKLGIENGKMANCNENIDEGTDAIRQIENDIHICNQKIALVNKFENISTIIESSESKPGGCVGSEDDNFDIKKGVESIVGKVGAVGGFTTMLASNIRLIIDGDATDASYVMGVLNGGWGTLKSLYKSYKALLKLDKVTLNDQIKSLFGYAFEGSTVKSLLTEFTEAPNIISNVIAFFSRGISNIDEYNEGKISKVRAVAETFTETGVKIAAGWAFNGLVTAGVTAVCSTPIGIGAVAVTAGVAAASWGLNELCKLAYKSVTGEEKDIAEAVSDFYLDIAQNVGSAAKQVGEKVVEGAKSALDSISNGINIIGRGFTSLFAW